MYYIKWNKKNKLIELILILLTVLFVGLVIFFNYQQGIQRNKIAELKNDNLKISNNISNKKENLANQVSQNALNNANPKIKWSARQMVATEQAESVVNNVFPILINYSSLKEYLARSEKASEYLSKSVLSNKMIFDKYPNDIDYIKWTKLHSQFKSLDFSAGQLKGNELPIVINVHYSSWEINHRRSLLHDLYFGTYNYKLDKITALRRFGNIYTGAENGD